MKTFCEINQKPVVSLKDFCIIGKVTDCLIDLEKAKITYYLCNKDDSEFLLGIDQVLSEKDVMTVLDRVECKDPLDIDFTLYKTVMFKDVYQTDGTAVGKVSDLRFDRGGNLCEIVAGETSIKPYSVLGVDEIVLVKSPQKRKYKKRPASITALATADRPVSVLDNSQNNLIDVDVKDAMIGPSVQTAPTRIIADYNFLLGRIIQEDLLTYSGQLIALKNTRISVEIVEKARQNGKLLELTLNSK
jgi:sporulation protein YlmC with PRC-barrel domain